MIFYGMCIRHEPLICEEYASYIVIFIISIYFTVQDHITDTSMYTAVSFAGLSGLVLLAHPVAFSYYTILEHCKVCPIRPIEVSNPTGKGSTVVEVPAPKTTV
jgi:hypothetical protein